jgi:DNA primase
LVLYINNAQRICGKEEGMAIRGNFARKIDSTRYTPSHIKSILKTLNINVVGETGNDFLAYCPFHSNRHSSSFSVSKEIGAWLCFNPSCGESGTLIDLVKRITKRNDYEALRFITVKEAEVMANFDELLEDTLEEKPDFIEFDSTTIDKLTSEMKQYEDGKNYMYTRGFTDETLEYFNVGYSNNRSMVTVPVHSPDGICVGVVGRSIKEKEFKNSPGLPRNSTIFNIHRAKRIGATCVVVESSFDAMRVHQAGFPNVVATLGGHISSNNLSLLNRYFNRIIIMTDNDEAGRSLGNNILNKLRNKDVLWASHSYGTIYPHDAKDAGDMTDQEIKACINNSVSHIEYISW